jgi:hypothetical protein
LTAYYIITAQSILRLFRKRLSEVIANSLTKSMSNYWESVHDIEGEILARLANAQTCLAVIKMSKPNSL